MAIDLGSSNTSRYHSIPDHVDFTLPNGDWSLLALVYPQSVTDIKYIFSTGTYGSSDGTNLVIYNTGSGLGAAVKVGGLDEVATTSPVPHDSWSWVYASRRSGILYVGQAPINGSVVEATGPSIFTGFDSTVGPRIGSRADLTANRFFKGRWGQVAFIPGIGITAAQAAQIASGSRLLEMPFSASIKFLLWGQSASATTLSDEVGGHVATRQGTGYGTNEEDAQTPYAASNHVLIIADASQNNTVDAVSLTQSHFLEISSSFQANTLESIAASQSHALGIPNAAQGNSISAGIVSQSHKIVIESPSQNNAVSSISVSPTQSLSIPSASHNNAVSAIEIFQRHVLRIVNTTQTNAAESMEIPKPVVHSLMIDAVVQSNTSPGFSITQLHVLESIASMQQNILSRLSTPDARYYIIAGINNKTSVSMGIDPCRNLKMGVEKCALASVS